MATWSVTTENAATWAAQSENAATWNIAEEGGTAWPYNDSTILYSDPRTLVRYNSFGGAPIWALQTEH